MKKKSLILASLLIATASLASCGAKKGDTSSQTTSNNPSSTVVSSLTADEQEAQSALKKFILTQDKGTVTATFTCPSTVTKNEKIVATVGENTYKYVVNVGGKFDKSGARGIVFTTKKKQ